MAVKNVNGHGVSDIFPVGSADVSVVAKGEPVFMASPLQNGGNPTEFSDGRAVVGQK
jgi:hypothetical protein